jgi:hypothetical protein
MHSDWFIGTEILQVDASMEKKRDTVIPADLKRLCKWDIYVLLVMRDFKEKFPKSLCGKCDCVLCNSSSRGISRRAPHKNDFLVLMKYKTQMQCIFVGSVYSIKNPIYPNKKIWLYCVHSVA